MRIIAELQRRNVIRIAIAYVVAAWLLLQITEVLQGLLELPNVIGKTIVLLLAVGFVPALVFAWVFELTPDGLKRETEIDRSSSIAPETGRRLNAVIIGMLVIIAAYFFWESRYKEAEATADVVAQAGAVTEVEKPADTQTQRAALDDEVSVAVLPFLNISANPDNVFFADGLSEEILNRLAQVPQLRVIGRSSSFAFRDETRDPLVVAETLGVTHILEGSVRRQVEQVRVTAQLVSAADGTQLWSKTFDRRIDDIFVIQDEIAERVVNALDIVLDETSRQAMLNAGVRDVDAFVAYQRGYRMVIDAHDGDPVDGFDERLAAAEPFLDKAIAAAPDFAAAYLAKSDRFSHLVLDGLVPVERRAEALVTLQQLYRIAADAARDPLRRKVIEVDRLFFSDNWTALPAALEVVFTSDGCATGNWMELAMPFAEPGSMIAYYTRQIECDPLTTLSHANKAILIVNDDENGGYDAARALLETGMSAESNMLWLAYGRMYVQLLADRADLLLAELREAPDEVPMVIRRATMGMALAALGREDESLAILEELASSGKLPGYYAISLYAVLGDRQRANDMAGAVDAQPGGPAELITAINACICGAPFDLESTPRLARRLNEAGWAWPPRIDAGFPAKDW